MRYTGDSFVLYDAGLRQAQQEAAQQVTLAKIYGQQALNHHLSNALQGMYGHSHYPPHSHGVTLESMHNRGMRSDDLSDGARYDPLTCTYRTFREELQQEIDEWLSI